VYSIGLSWEINAYPLTMCLPFFFGIAYHHFLFDYCHLATISPAEENIERAEEDTERGGENIEKPEEDTERAGKDIEKPENNTERSATDITRAATNIPEAGNNTTNTAEI